MPNQTPTGDAEREMYFYFLEIIACYINAPRIPELSKILARYAAAREEAQREALAIEERIKENQLYLTEKNRHYYPASPIDPYIPLVQFAERISELQLKLKHLKDPERS